MNEWDRLRARYSSKGQYLNRKVLFKRGDFEDFSNWLVDQGAEVLSEPKQDEALRFRLNGELGLFTAKALEIYWLMILDTSMTKIAAMTLLSITQ